MVEAADKCSIPEALVALTKPIVEIGIQVPMAASVAEVVQECVLITRLPVEVVVDTPVVEVEPVVLVLVVAADVSSQAILFPKRSIMGWEL